MRGDQERRRASAANPFVTQSRLPILPGDPPPPEWPIGLTPAQDAALDAAEAKGPPDAPSATNPFVTQSMLPNLPTDPPALPIGLTSAQKEGLDYARKAPSEVNPFATIADLPNGSGSCDLTDDQCEAMNSADPPSAGNPFVTRSELSKLPPAPPPPILPIGLTLAQDAAVDAAEAYPDVEHRPDLFNPFVTQSRWPRQGRPCRRRPRSRTRCQPSGDNPFATLADLDLVGITTRVVPAGNLDLRGNNPAPVLGGLKIVAAMPASGLVTLSFEGYKQDRQGYYIVKALPVNGQAGLDLQSLTVVQLAEFTAQGFVLHMSQPLTKSTNLGRCMIEVSEMLEAVAPAESSLERAIRTYYLLIRQRHYADAWPMLSQRYKNSHGQTIFDPNDQENPIPGFDPIIRGYLAKVVVGLKRGGNILDAAAANNFAHRIVHVSGAGESLDAPWKGKFDQDGNRPNFGVWHVVKPGDVREHNSDWYRCEIYAGEPQDWNNPGEPIAITRAFQLPRTGHEQVITVELDHPVSQSLDLARFTQEWEATGPAEITALKRVAATPARATYDLDLLYTNTNLSKRIQYAFERDVAEGHQRFDFWLYIEGKG